MQPGIGGSDMGKIFPLGSPETHFWLTRSMARRLGVNLSEAMADDLLSPQSYAAMVTRCRQCPHVGACQAWLAQSTCAPEAPDHCLNAAIFNRLRH